MIINDSCINGSLFADQVAVRVMVKPFTRHDITQAKVEVLPNDDRGGIFCSNNEQYNSNY